MSDVNPTIEDVFPPHRASLTLRHNDHKNYYQSAEDWARDNDANRFADWISDEQRAKAIETDSIWTIQWYPHTPVGFCALAAADLELLLAFASASSEQES